MDSTPTTQQAYGLMRWRIFTQNYEFPPGNVPEPPTITQREDIVWGLLLVECVVNYTIAFAAISAVVWILKRPSLRKQSTEA